MNDIPHPKVCTSPDQICGAPNPIESSTMVCVGMYALVYTLNTSKAGGWEVR